ncbi:MAG: carboxypeptidase M32 [Bdellovibrionales bacterium]
MQNYQTVEKYFRRISRLAHLRAMAGWDEAVMMPKGGGEARAMAVSELALLNVEIYREQALAEAIKEAQNELSGLSDWQRANLREAKSSHARMNAVDPKLVEKQTAHCMASEQAWRELRHANNWQDFAPILEKGVEYAREESRQRAAATGLKPYDAMLDLYEPGLRITTVERVFGELRQILPDLIEEIIVHQAKQKVVSLNRPVPTEKQRAMMKEFMAWLGFDFERGRLDESHHPFCGGVPQDVRLTTRYSEQDYLSGLMGVMHETGHAMYEQGLPKEWLEQPVGAARGMAFHESQSLFVEMQIARCREFAQYAAPILQRYLSEHGDPAGYWMPENLTLLLTRVRKGYIRVDADEVTYPAHIILRFEIERALIEGDLQVKELPAVWNEKMQKYLGLSTLGNDKNGCMQDVHWPSGAFGYFPSYSLGALTASQLFAALQKQIPTARAGLAKGEIKPIMDWLRKNVWSQGSALSSEDLMIKVTGEPLSVQPFINHVKQRYLRD